MMIAVGPDKSISVKFLVADGVVAIIFILLFFSQLKALIPLVSNVGTVNNVPTLALTTLGII